MQPSVPSRSALRVALRRAAHQLYDERPLVFEDPLAVAILGPHAAELQRTPGRGLGRRPGQRSRAHSYSLRAFLVARSRYAEDWLTITHSRGVRQYVLLGAGLDTFAYRNPYPDLRVFEADYPSTQAWKRELLAQANLKPPCTVHYVSVDLESDELARAMAAVGLDSSEPSFIACLGVVPYLSENAFGRLLRFFAGQASGSAAVFDYTQPRHEHTGVDQLAYDSMSLRSRAGGEPFHLHRSPEILYAELTAAGLLLDEDLGFRELNARYFVERKDSLQVLRPAGRIVSLHR